MFFPSTKPTQTQVGLGAALRLSALSHVSDPVVRGASSFVQRRALEVALRLQHLAAGWLIYAYNGDLDLHCGGSIFIICGDETLFVLNGKSIKNDEKCD